MKTSLQRLSNDELDALLKQIATPETLEGIQSMQSEMLRLFDAGRREVLAWLKAIELVQRLYPEAPFSGMMNGFALGWLAREALKEKEELEKLVR